MGEQNILVMLMGLPQAGKTTWAQKQGLPMVNLRAVRLALYNQQFVADTEKFVWAMTYYMVRALFLAGHRKVILDATNLTRKGRDYWMAPNEVWRRRIVVFNTSKEECIARALKNQDLEIVPVIERMAREWEPAEEIEAFDTIETDVSVLQSPEWTNP